MIKNTSKSIYGLKVQEYEKVQVLEENKFEKGISFYVKQVLVWLCT